MSDKTNDSESNSCCLETASCVVEHFAIRNLELLELERTAEIEENKGCQENSSVKHLQNKGVCIPRLQIKSTSTGLFGRSLINFEPVWGKGTLPAHTISNGDIVGIGSSSSDGRVEIVTSGVVTRVSEVAISVSFDKDADFSELDDNRHYMVIKLANDVTYKRLKRCLKTLHGKGRDHHLVDVLFGAKQPTELQESDSSELTFFNKNLNAEQKDAVKFSLTQKEIAIVHGPPGTGKTTTVVECILQAVAQKLKVLACAPSNIAVDNLVEKLSSHKVKMVRLGHPARFLTHIQKFSLDAILSCYDGSNVVDELRKEIDKLRDRIRQTRGGHKKSLWAENRSLVKEVKNREKLIVTHILTHADVVLCTLTSGSDDGPLKCVAQDHFDVCFVDECSQSIEAACWIPLLTVRKCVLAGDHNQLPPTILSRRAAKEGLEKTLMERLLELHGDGIKRMLRTQYRMNRVIMQWPSERLYDGKLVAHDSVCRHLLRELPGVEDNDDTSVPLLLIDTHGCGLHEMEVESDDSKGNEGEADLVVAHLKNLLRSGVDPSDVAVITPYNLQVDLIKSRLEGKHGKIEVKSVDGFQGREKEAVVLSLVRSNETGEVGFLAEDRRINVAITRAKRHVAVICDTKTVSRHEFLKSFVGYCEEKGEVRSAFQYEREIGNYPARNRTNLSSSDKKKPPVKNKKDGNNLKDSPSNKTTPSAKSGDKKMYHSEEEKRSVTEAYETALRSFVASDQASVSFPSSLTSFERMVIHEISEKLGLIHVSSGEGQARCIEVKKTETTGSSEILLPAAPETIEPESHDTTEPESATSECIPDGNPEAEPSTRPVGNSTKTRPRPEPQSAKTEKKKRPPKPKLKVLKLKETETEDDFDALIQQVVKSDRTCRFLNCKKCVATLCQVCEFCKGRFCYTHFMPEIHGCGDAVRAHARSQIRKEGVLHPGSGKTQKKADPVKHAYLQKKLDKKISDLSSQRSQKKS